MEPLEPEFIEAWKVLDSLNDVFYSFVKENGGSLVQNYHSSPNRQIRIMIGGLSCIIHIAPYRSSSEAKVTYSITTSAYVDVVNERFIHWTEIACLRSEEMRPETLAMWLKKALTELQGIDADYVMRHGQRNALPRRE